MGKPLPIETIDVQFKVFSSRLSFLPNSGDEKASDPFHCMIGSAFISNGPASEEEISILIPGKRGYDYYEGHLQRFTRSLDIKNQRLPEGEKTRIIPLKLDGYFANYSKITQKKYELAVKTFIIARWSFEDTFRQQIFTEGELPFKPKDNTK